MTPVHHDARPAAARQAHRGLAALSRSLRAWVLEEDGLSSVEWVVVAAGAAGLGFVLMAGGQDGLADYSVQVRDEVQSPHFQTDWLDEVPVSQE